MKKLTVKKDGQCMACLECVQACSKAFYKEFHQDKSCIRITGSFEQLKPLVCVQCGKCARNCEFGAISQNAKGTYVIDKNKCTGCGKCVEVCPFGLIVKAEDKPTASKCIACGICVKACPMDILEIVET